MKLRPKSVVTYVSKKDFFVFLCRFDTAILAASFTNHGRERGAISPASGTAKAES